MARPTIRLIVDIDDTLYPTDAVWDELMAGTGIDVTPRLTWDFWRDHFSAEEFDAIVKGRFHSSEQIFSNVPFAGAAETLAAWRERGAEIHIVSDRDLSATRDTLSWLHANEIPYDATHFGYGIDKLGYCRDHGIELVIDDKPSMIERAHGAGLVTASIRHPYNEATIDALPGVVSAYDWDELRDALESVVPALRPIARAA